MFSCGFREIFKITVFYRALPMANAVINFLDHLGLSLLTLKLCLKRNVILFIIKPNTSNIAWICTIALWFYTPWKLCYDYFIFYSSICQSFISILNFIGHSTLVGQRPMKPISSIRPSVCPSSLRPSLNFFKMRSLAFSDIVYDDSRPWYLVTDVARFLVKRVKIGHETFFYLAFSQVRCVSFLWIYMPR